MDELGAQQIQVHTAASLAELMCVCVCDTHTHTKSTQVHRAASLAELRFMCSCVCVHT